MFLTVRVCLVGATHPCHNPRLVREADTLAALGHAVRVVTPYVGGDLAACDRRLLAGRRWEHCYAWPPEGPGTYWRRARRRGAAALFRVSRDRALAVESALAGAGRLAATAAAERADWYIAHTQPALSAAVHAAERWDAALGFDCEDLLADDSNFGCAIGLIEQSYLPLCRYVSAPSRGIASTLHARGAGCEPVILRNVLPLALACGLRPPARRPVDGTVRLHWVSQTIGPDRGLEDAFAALALLPPNVELHLRGQWARGYRNKAESLTQHLRVADRVHHYPVVDHDLHVLAAGCFDIGLALERLEPINRALTATNKLFAYVLAGLAVAASETPGQREALEALPASVTYPPGDAAALAAALQPWVEDAGALQCAKQAAWDAARESLNWDREQTKLLDCLDARSMVA
ncbi:MAG TPA: hypothetical protein VKX16_18030 [Chloroflexota bacterium]|nr:hypothetical protein [Chloroflexota bacterium]